MIKLTNQTTTRFPTCVLISPRFTTPKRPIRLDRCCRKPCVVATVRSCYFAMCNNRKGVAHILKILFKNVAKTFILSFCFLNYLSFTFVVEWLDRVYHSYLNTDFYGKSI